MRESEHLIPDDYEVDPDRFPERARLELHVRDYVKAGWTVVKRTGREAELTLPTRGSNSSTNREIRRVRVWLDESDTVQTDGEPLSGLPMDGRWRAWLLLIAMLSIAFSVAWVMGYFN